MEFGGMVALKKNEIKCLESSGCTRFEAHMIYEEADISRLEEFKGLFSQTKMQCYCLHAPNKDNNGNPLNLGAINTGVSTNTIDSVKSTLLLADKLNIPNVITHLGDYTDCMYNHSKYAFDRANTEKLAIKQLEHIIRFIEDNKISTNLCLENIPSVGRGDNETALFGTRLDAHNLVKDTEHKQVKTALDICHMLVDVAVDTHASITNALRITDYIDIYAKTAGIVHFNYLRKFALDRESHAIPFSDKDFVLFDKIMVALNENNYQCPVTFEVYEDEYTAPNGYANYKQMVKLAKMSAECNNIDIKF